jgi:hypothetical protein
MICAPHPAREIELSPLTHDHSGAPAAGIRGRQEERATHSESQADWLLAEGEASRCLHRAERRLFGRARATSVRLQFGQMFLRPAAERMQRIDQCASEPRERVFHLGRDDRMNLAYDQAVALQAAECLGEHLLGNPTDLPL